MAALELLQWAPQLDAQETLPTLNLLVAWLCAAADAAGTDEADEGEGEAATPLQGLGYMTRCDAMTYMLW